MVDLSFNDVHPPTNIYVCPQFLRCAIDVFFMKKKVSIVIFAPFWSMQLFKYLIVKYSIIVLLAITCPVAITSSFECALIMWFYLVVFLMTIQLVSLGILQVPSLTIAWSLIYRWFSFVLWWSWKWSEWWCSCKGILKISILQYGQGEFELFHTVTLFLFSTLPSSFNLLFFIKRMLISSVPGYTGQVDW